VKENNTMITNTVKTEQLAERYATLKVEIKRLDAKLKEITEELMLQLKPGDAVVTPEYRLACNPGRSVFTWLCSKEKKKEFEEQLIKQGIADIKLSDPYIQIRFLKQAAE
jgi:hypothetical protein